MAWAQTDLDVVEAAIASGELTVRFDGPPARSITYRSMSELITARDVIKGSLALAAGNTYTSFVQHSRE